MEKHLNIIAFFAWFGAIALGYLIAKYQEVLKNRKK
tara:strand:- start:52390 stop:52497 length:108 start_codon:yes stop_codon:yes gene_type:complete